MFLEEIIARLNDEHIDNDFHSEVEDARKSRPEHDLRNWVIVRFYNRRTSWRGMPPGSVMLYEALPAGWPLDDVARRLGCKVTELMIVENYIGKGRWLMLADAEHGFLRK